MVQSSQRKAWNDAMKSAAGGTSGRESRRSSDRHKKNARREKARKSVDQSESSLENRLYRAATRIDSLEGIMDNSVPDEEEEYDEEKESDKNTGGGGGSSSAAANKRKRSSGRGGGGAAGKKNAPGVLPKHLRPRTLASILVEDAGRADGVARNYLDAEARPILGRGGKYPPRKFCPVTGLFGVYTDPKSGVPYANLKALEQIRERAPPWMSLGGSAAYYEAVKSLRDED